MLNKSDVLACKNNEIRTNFQSLCDEWRVIPMGKYETNQDTIRLDSADIELGSDKEVDYVEPENSIITFGGPEPEFQGGIDALNQFINENIRIPDLDSSCFHSTTVYVRFTIDEAGNAVDEEIVKGDFEVLNQEALRLIRILPKWDVGTVNGKKYRIKYTLPIHFYLH